MLQRGSRGTKIWVGTQSLNQDVGRIKAVRWANPHAEVVLVVDGAMKLPADLGRRSLPAQSQNVDGAAILARTRLPEQAGGEWTVEFAPLTRMQAWGVREPKAGDRIEVIRLHRAEDRRRATASGGVPVR